MKKKISLNGFWDWHVPGGKSIKMEVPSSYICVGIAVLEKEFDLVHESHKREYLCFEGIHYTGNVEFNGFELGEMLPYIPYRFDITDHLDKKGNKLIVTVNDITADFGPTGGWEDYGGIGRDVFIDIRDEVQIADFQLISKLNDNFTVSDCMVNAWVTNATNIPVNSIVSINMSFLGNTVYIESKPARITDDETPIAFAFKVEHPALWSPEYPNLYDFSISVKANDKVDEVNKKVGIKEFRTEGSKFLLNGVETFLKGVARHEMWGDTQGFTLTVEQIEQDLRLIKQMGANFVRLVHYPHSRATIEVADRIGLMVSEEPGLWWSDMGNEKLTDMALEIMRRTILRDRNSPSVIAWLFFNECVLKNAKAYLKKGHDLCKNLDPTRLVSGANCMESSEAKEVFDDCGFDFYTQHPYVYDPDVLIKAMEIFKGKPLVFTEWGGWLIHNNQNLLKWFKKVMSRCAHNHDPEPNFAGMCWWQWQDVYQWSRGLPACEKGVLSDGLVDCNRNRKPMYNIMSEFFDLIDMPYDHGYTVEDVGNHNISNSKDLNSFPLDLSKVKQSEEQQKAWEYALDNIRKFELTRNRAEIRNTGPIMPVNLENVGGLHVRIDAGAPVVLAGDCMKVEIPIGKLVNELHMLGQTTYFDGYPVRGASGELLAQYTLCYEDGSIVVIPLRNGMEMASASMLAINSRINPIAVNAERILKIMIDPDWEVYQVNHFMIKTDSSQKLEKIIFESLNTEYYPLLYGITADVKGK